MRREVESCGSKKIFSPDNHYGYHRTLYGWNKLSKDRDSQPSTSIKSEKRKTRTLTTYYTSAQHTPRTKGLTGKRMGQCYDGGDSFQEGSQWATCHRLGGWPTRGSETAASIYWSSINRLIAAKLNMKKVLLLVSLNDHVATCHLPIAFHVTSLCITREFWRVK